MKLVASGFEISFIGTLNKTLIEFGLLLEIICLFPCDDILVNSTYKNGCDDILPPIPVNNVVFGNTKLTSVILYKTDWSCDVLLP